VTRRLVRGTLAERLAAYIVVDESGCHIWTGYLDRQGYGHIGTGAKTFATHRLAYEFAKGPIPDGLTIDHLCRVRACCNPDHLEAVTTRVNVLRGTGITAVNARKTHCRNGHEFDDKNTYIWTDGHRRCLACTVEWNRKHRTTNRETQQ
jgi:hypothetical protein